MFVCLHRVLFAGYKIKQAYSEHYKLLQGCDTAESNSKKEEPTGSDDGDVSDE